MTDDHRALRVLFRVAAGPRVGFGHLVRAASLAEALGVPARISIRGAHASVGRAARALGASIVSARSASRELDAARPDVLVLDDRVARETRAWRRAARRRGLPVVSIHDLGLGVGDADLIVDGSIGASMRGGNVPALLGPRYAILNPRATEEGRHRRRRPGGPDVVISLGGGPRRAAALAIARVLHSERPALRIAVAVGFVRGGRASGGYLRWLDPAELGTALAGCRVAVVGGGVTLYECLGLGVPAVAVSVVDSQRPTIAAFAAAHAVVDGGRARAGATEKRAAARLAGKVLALLDDRTSQTALRRTGRALVDGRGAARVAAAIRALSSAPRRAGARSR
jgi:UDP-2,4-diacetamido-2,4,6-trideoxy-beta-L-altropyranose hydrolase